MIRRDKLLQKLATDWAAKHWVMWPTSSDPVVLIWALARAGFLTRRDYAGMRLGEIQRIEYFLVDVVVL